MIRLLWTSNPKTDELSLLPFFPFFWIPNAADVALNMEAPPLWLADWNSNLVMYFGEHKFSLCQTMHENRLQNKAQRKKLKMALCYLIISKGKAVNTQLVLMNNENMYKIKNTQPCKLMQQDNLRVHILHEGIGGNTVTEYCNLIDSSWGAGNQINVFLLVDKKCSTGISKYTR